HQLLPNPPVAETDVLAVERRLTFSQRSEPADRRAYSRRRQKLAGPDSRALRARNHPNNRVREPLASIRCRTQALDQSKDARRSRKDLPRDQTRVSRDW